MVFKSLIGAACAGLVLSSFSGNAAPLNYDEYLDGDIVNNSTLFLDVGTNIIKGNVTNPSQGETDFDKFDVLFPGSVLVEKIAITVDSYSVQYPSWFEYQLDFGSSIYSIDIIGDGFYESAVGERRAGLYYVGLNSFPDNVNADYEISIVVSAVPLPAAAWLFISAIAGLAGAKRLSRSKGSA